jgi:hypothetical protein
MSYNPDSSDGNNYSAFNTSEPNPSDSMEVDADAAAMDEEYSPEEEQEQVDYVDDENADAEDVGNADE